MPQMQSKEKQSCLVEPGLGMTLEGFVAVAEEAGILDSDVHSLSGNFYSLRLDDRQRQILSKAGCTVTESINSRLPDPSRWR